ncbi:TIR domain-containing protein [Ralstonia pseudosolanacearum]|uniref:TIR domain-containing protein n=1 Tax=Ralstonia pseudosolanacearum TaxID=1310165 RepID=UPI003D022A84
MGNFAKAFVSHSSTDKPLVEEVVQTVSAARWEIDSHTFEEGKYSAGEIAAALGRSDLFVLIASAHSMGSEWVKSELEIAQHLLYAGRLGGVIAFIVDGTQTEELPEWLRMHVFIRTSNPVRIANLIRSKLVELDTKRGVKPKPYVQRIKLQAEMERRIADLRLPIQAIYLSGVDGIGKRAVGTRTLEPLFPGRDITGIEISVADGEGVLEVYRKIHFAWQRPTAAEARKFLDESAAMRRDELVEKTCELLRSIDEQKMFVWLRFDYDILDDDGNLQLDLAALLRALTNKRPTLVICAKRLPRVAAQRRLENVGFFKVEGLTEDESGRVWTFALEHLQFDDLEPQFLNFLRGEVSGHPAMIWTAAEYVASSGRAAIEANPRDLMEALRGLSVSLVEGLALTPTAKKLLALFDEFNAIDPTDLLEICGDQDQEVADSVTRLVSLGLLESEHDHLRIASYFRRARFRKQFAAETEEFVADARWRLLGITASYKDEDDISFETIDLALTNSIALGKPVSALFGERAVVGSHYLRVARNSYDRERYEDAVRFAMAALDKRHTLTNEAVVESLRLLGMASVRTGTVGIDSLAHAIEELKKIGTNQAVRHVHFIQGFEHRWNGVYERAEAEFVEVLKFNARDTHALRELAQLLVGREEYQEAERYARDALERNPGNPFILDVLIQCLVERGKENLQLLAADEELEELFAQLQIADRREQSDFTDLRRAQYFAALKDFSEAMRWADAAVRKSPGKVGGYVTRAEIKLRVKNDAKVFHSVDADIKHIQAIADESKGTKSHVALLAKLRVRYELAKGNVGAAIEQLNRAPWTHRQLRKKLAWEIALEIVDKKLQDPDLVAFANQALASG